MTAVVWFRYIIGNCEQDKLPAITLLLHEIHSLQPTDETENLQKSLAKREANRDKYKAHM